MGLTGEQYTIQVKASADVQSFNNVKKELNTLLSDLNRPGMEKYWGISKTQRQELSKSITQFKQDFESSFNKELGTINLSALSEKMKAHGTNVQAIGQAYQLLGMKGSHAFRELSAEIITTNRDLSHTKTIWDDMFKTMSNTIKWGISSSLMNTFTGSVQKAYGYVKDLDKSLTDIRIVSGASADEMERFAKQANSAAKNLGATTLDYTDAALIYYQQGLSDEEITKRTDVTIKMSNALGTSAEEVSDYMTAIWNNFYDGSKSLEYYADVLAKLGAATASSAEEISDGLEKFAAISQTVGLSYEYAAAALTTVTAATRQSADVVGTAFKTLFARIQDLELGETLEDGVTLGKYSEALKAVGINIMESNGELKDMDAILDEMGSKWDTLTKAQQVSLAQTVAGTRQYTQLVALMDNWDDFQKNITMAGGATGELNKQQKIYMDSVEAAMNRARASAEELYSAIFDEETIKDLAGAVENLAALFTNLANAVGGGNNALVLFGGRILQNVSKNIGQSAIKFKENRDRNKRNKALLQAEADITEQFAGQDLSDSVHNQIVGWKKDFLEYGNLIEDTQQNEIDNLINTQVELSKQKDLWDQNIEALKSYWNQHANIVTGNEKEAERDFLNESDLNATKDSLKTLENVFNTLEKKSKSLDESVVRLSNMPLLGKDSDLESINNYIKALSTMEVQLDSIAKTLESSGELGQESIKNSFENDNNLRSFYASKEDATIQRMYLKNITKDKESLSEKERQGVNEALLDYTADIKQAYQKILAFIDKENPSKHLETISQAIDGQGRDIEAALERNVGKVESLKEKFDFGAMVQGATEFAGSLAEVIGAINSLRSSFEILNNDEATFGDKLAALAAIIYSLIFGFKSLASMFTIVTAGWTSITSAQVVTAVSLKGVKVEADKATMSMLALSQAQQAAAGTAQANSVAQLAQAKNLKVTSNMSSLATGSTLSLNKATMTTTTSATGFAGIAAKLGVSVATLGAVLAVVAVAIAAVGTALYLNWKMEEQEKQNLEQIKKAEEDLAQAAEETASKLSEVRGILDKYDSAVEILNKCTEGTDEWNEALKNVNQTVLDLLSAYPALNGMGNIYSYNNGQLTLNKEALEEQIKLLEQSQQIQQAAKLAAGAWSASASNKNAQEDLIKDINKDFKKTVENDQTRVDNEYQLSSSWDPAYEEKHAAYERMKAAPKIDTNIISQDQLEALANLPIEEYNEKLRQYAEAAVESGALTKEGADDWVKKMSSYQKSIDNLANNTDEAATKMKNVAIALGLIVAGNDSTNLEQGVTSEYINQQLESSINQEYQWIKDNFKKSDNYTDNYVDLMNDLNKASGGKYTAIADRDKNVIFGDDENREFLVINTETGKEERVSASEVATLVGTNKVSEKAKGAGLEKRTDEILDYVAKELGISKDVADQLLSGKLDINSLTEDEYEKIKNADMTKITEEIAKKDSVVAGFMLKAAGASNKETFTNMINDMVEEWDPKAAAENAAQKWKQSLKDAAEELEISEDALEAYTNQLLLLNPELEAQSDLLLEVAKRHFTLTKHLNNLHKVMGNEDNDNIFDKWKADAELTTDEMEVVGAAITEIKGIFGEDISEDFIKEHLEDIRKLAEGDESLLDDLQKAAAEDIITNINVDDEYKTKVNDLINQINGLNIPDIEIGTSLDATGLTTMLQELLNSAAITAQEAESILSTIGYEPKIDYVDAGIVYSNGTSATVEYTDPVTNEKKQIENFATSATQGTIKIPLINGDTSKYKGANDTNFKFDPKDKTKGGGSKKKSKVEKTEGEKDRYHDVNIQLKQLSDEMSKLQDQKDKLFGGDLIKNTIKQIETLNKQIETTNKKIKIAEGEAAELRKKLANQGVKFNNDGTMSNYLTIYDKKLKELNAIETKYDKMSEKQREKYQDTYEKAKENFQKFVEDMSRYDEVITDLLPGLAADNQEFIDKQIELQIESFNAEIELRLELKDAELEWNEFKKKIIDGIEDDDIFENAKASLQDFFAYYKEDGTGIIQENAEHLEELLAELKEMDANGSDVYGKGSTQDRVTALEDLQKYYQELMGQLEEVKDLQDEIKQSQLDMMDEAQEKLGEQLDMYENISGLIDHDMNLINLVYGETAYDKLIEFYEKQEENNLNQLDMQKQQVEFWKNQMESAEKGSESWEKARDNWIDAVDQWNAAVEDAIKNLQDKYLNAINDIFDRLNDKVTDGAGLDYIAEEWNLINQNADQYLDTVNSLFEMQSLENKYLDAIDDTDNVKAQQKLQKMMEEELKMLEEKDKLTQYDIDRANQKYEIALKQIALEEAQQNKNSMRLRRDTQGNYTYQFVADDEQVSQLQDELGDLYNSLYNLDVDQYKENLNQLQDIYVEFQEKMKEAAQINDPEERAERELLIREQYEELINGIVNENEVIRNNLYESTFNDLAYLYDKNVEDFTNMTQAEQDALMNELIPYWNSGIQSMADVFAGEGGFLPTCKDAFNELNQATQAYEDSLKEIEETAGVSFDKVADGVDSIITQTEELLSDNNELIDSYNKELEAIQSVVNELDGLVNKYKEAEEAAKAATEEAYKYWQEQNREAAQEYEDYNESIKEGEGASANNEAATYTAPTTNNEAKKPSLTQGSYVDVKAGTKWYANSYGGGNSGTARSGKITYINSNGSHPYNIGGLGWIKKSDIVGYDTGGYTGNWNSREGRLAMLHEKELILNKQDTQNMLNAMQVLRNITANLGTTIMEKMASITAGNMNAIANNFNNGLEQQVHIDAQFPNVTNSTEIEDALNNLVNRASQYITK